MTTHIRVAQVLSALALAGLASTSMANTWTLSYEAPAVQNTTATFSLVGVETFDAHPASTNQSFPTTFGGSPISGNYTGIAGVAAANQYGGAGGVGNFATTLTGTPYTLTINSPTPVNYFGYWLSALNTGNTVTFYNGATQVGQFDAGTLVGASVTGNPAYRGNPNPNFLHQAPSEIYVYINFYATGAGDTFDRIVFSGAGQESDNHTVGVFETIGGNVIPEPASWGLLLLGLFAIGGILKSQPTRRQGMV